jgi:archaemetzincin
MSSPPRTEEEADVVVIEANAGEGEGEGDRARSRRPKRARRSPPRLGFTDFAWGDDGGLGADGGETPSKKTTKNSSSKSQKKKRRKKQSPSQQQQQQQSKTLTSAAGTAAEILGDGDDDVVVRFPFVRGFRRATPRDQLLAAGGARLSRDALAGAGNEPPPPTDLAWCAWLAARGGDELFPPIPDPVDQDDWLHQFIEPRQSYAQWRAAAPSPATRHRSPSDAPLVVSLCAFGEDFEERSGFALQELCEFVELFYPGIQVRTQSPALAVRAGKGEGSLEVAFTEHTRNGSRPRHIALHWRRCHEYDMDKPWATADHRQFAVTPLMRAVASAKPRSAFCVLGATMEDLFWDDTDSFTMGSAGGSSAGLFSFLRYDPAFGRGSKKKKKKEMQMQMQMQARTADERSTLFARACRTMVHELGHLLGFGHCVYYSCLMQGSGSLDEDYRIPDAMCPVCLAKLQHVCGGCDLALRFRRLGDFYGRHSGFARAAAWTRRAIDVLGIAPTGGASSSSSSSSSSSPLLSSLEEEEGASSAPVVDLTSP